MTSITVRVCKAGWLLYSISVCLQCVCKEEEQGGDQPHTKKRGRVCRIVRIQEMVVWFCERFVISSCQSSWVIREDKSDNKLDACVRNLSVYWFVR